MSKGTNNRLRCPWPECGHEWETPYRPDTFHSCPKCHQSIETRKATVVPTPEEGAVERGIEAGCHIPECGRDATCYGRYEGHGPVTTTCDVHCGHGNEDGWCVPIEEADAILQALGGERVEKVWRNGYTHGHRDAQRGRWQPEESIRLYGARLALHDTPSEHDRHDRAGGKRGKLDTPSEGPYHCTNPDCDWTWYTRGVVTCPQCGAPQADPDEAVDRPEPDIDALEGESGRPGLGDALYGMVMANLHGDRARDLIYEEYRILHDTPSEGEGLADRLIEYRDALQDGESLPANAQFFLQEAARRLRSKGEDHPEATEEGEDDYMIQRMETLAEARPGNIESAPDQVAIYSTVWEEVRDLLRLAACRLRNAGGGDE